jgi:hypothetical protein
MIDLPLTPAERSAFEAALRTSHRMRVKLELFDRNEESLGELGGKLLSGSVQIDSTADVRRSLSLSLLDERGRIRFEPDSPSEGSVHADNYISAKYGVGVSSLVARDFDLDPFWVDVPVFYGPVTLFERNGAEAKVECQGKESLMLAPHYVGKGYTLRKGDRTDEAIEKVARHAGEERFLLPDMPKRLPRARGVGPHSEGWKVIRGGEESAKGKPIPGLIAKGGADMEPYYNGRGELTARRKGGNSRYTFDASQLTDTPTFRYDVKDFRNVVDVAGGKKKGKQRAHARESLPDAHPLSPKSLARNGEPRFMLEFLESDGLKTDQECAHRAKVELGRLSHEGVSASFESLVVPHLEEDDEVTLDMDDFAISFPLTSMTIPLTATETMSVGAQKRVR